MQCKHNPSLHDHHQSIHVQIENKLFTRGYTLSEPKHRRLASMHLSRTLGNRTKLTPSPQHVLDDMRMRHLRPHAAAGVVAIVRAAAAAELTPESRDHIRIGGLGVGFEQAGEMVDVAAGEADEEVGLCRGVVVSMK